VQRNDAARHRWQGGGEAVLSYANAVESASQFTWIESDACPLCGTTNRRFLGLRGGPTHRLHLGEPTRIYRCGDCRLIYCDPMPVARDLTLAYGDVAEYWKTGAPAGGLAFRALTRHLQPPAVVLDVGAGTGGFVRKARNAGFDAWGVEPSDLFRKAAPDEVRDFILPGTIHDVPSIMRFDAIILGAVIEHLTDPIEVLRRASALLRPGGLLYVDTQNEDGVYGVLFDLYARWRSFRTGTRVALRLAPTFRPFHLFGFAAVTLERALRMNGFEVAYRRLYPGAAVLPPSDSVITKVAEAVISGLVRLSGAGNYMEFVGRKIVNQEPT
jgi:SAM-dependent methyltransferase